MNIVSAKCPNCGANIQVDSERDNCFCSFCGSKIQTQEAISLVVKIDKSTDYKNFIQLAKENADMSQFDDALTYVEKALEIKPKSAQAWMLKAFYTSQCKVDQDSTEDIIEPGWVFFDENYEKVLVSGQKAISYASENSEDANYASLIYRLFLGIAKVTLMLTENNASDHSWLRARYEELELVCYPGQIAHWGQHQHEEILAEEDSENMKTLTDSLNNVILFISAVPKEFITPKYYAFFKELADLYAKCFQAMNVRMGVYNDSINDEYLKYSKEKIAFILSYLPESESNAVNSAELSSKKQKKTSVGTILLEILIFILVMVFTLIFVLYK